MNRHEMVEVIVNDLPEFLKQDSGGFWDHISDMERLYLGKMNDKEIKEMYEEV